MHQMGHAACKDSDYHACKADKQARKQYARMVDSRKEIDDIHYKNESRVGKGQNHDFFYAQGVFDGERPVCCDFISDFPDDAKNPVARNGSRPDESDP